MAIQINESDKKKIQDIIREGVSVNVEIKTLREGLKDTVTSFAKELDINPSLINKAISIAFKGDFDAQQEKLDDIEEILLKAGYRHPDGSGE